MAVTRASLLLRIRDPKDNAAWREFDAIYRPMLQRFARTMGLGAADAEDVVQHCMEKIFKHIQSFDYNPAKGRFKSWLRTLVNNRTRNLWRGRPNQQAETQDFDRPQDREPLPEEEFEKVWMESHLQHALRQVREEVEESSFDAYRRYAMNGEPVKKVCDDLGLNPNQLYAIKFRITRKLHEKMKTLTDGTQMPNHPEPGR